MYTCGGFVLMFGKTNTVFEVLKKKSVLIKKKLKNEFGKKKKEGMGAENTHYQSYLKKEFYQTVYISSGKSN